MKYVIIILSIICFAFLAVRAYNYFSKNASIEGIVYLEVSSNKVKPIKNMAVYLLNEEIIYELENIKEDYRNNIKPLEEEIKLLKKSYYDKEEIADRDLLMLKKLESLRNKGKTYNELKKKYNLEKNERDETYQKYFNLLEEFSLKRRKYNSLFEDLFNEYFFRSTKTDEKGRYQFQSIKKGNYYLYAVEGNLINTNVWLIEVILDEDKFINLSKKNVTDIFK